MPVHTVRMRIMRLWLQKERSMKARTIWFAGVLILLAGTQATADTPKVTPDSGLVSYHKQIWPLLQAKCQACHQPASPGGKLVLTAHADFLKGGEHGAVVIAGKPEASAVLDYLT